MINLRKAKWPKMPKTKSTYLSKFSVAMLNFEQNQIEEKIKLKNITLMIARK
jgi:hypothetical protein